MNQRLLRDTPRLQSRVVSGLVIVLLFAVVVAVAAGAVVGIRRSYVAYVSQPPLKTFVSDFGYLSVSYPRGMAGTVRKYGNDWQVLTVTSPYAASDLARQDTSARGVLLLVRVRDFSHACASCDTLDQAYSTELSRYESTRFNDEWLQGRDGAVKSKSTHVVGRGEGVLYQIADKISSVSSTKEIRFVAKNPPYLYVFEGSSRTSVGESGGPDGEQVLEEIFASLTIGDD